MRPLGAALDGDDVSDELHILLTHLHLDHLQGLGFFRPLFRPGRDIHIWGPASPVQTLAERIAIYLSPPLFPVRLADMPAHLTFHDAPEEAGRRSAPRRVRAANVTHQGPTVGYRIEEDGRTLAYVPDHEPSIGGRLADQPDRLDQRATTSRATSTCCSTTRSTSTTSTRDHVGWGHSSHRARVELRRARREVGRLVLFHHDPYHTDDDLEAAPRRGPRAIDAPSDWVCLAYEGMRIELDPTGVRVAERPLSDV